MLTIVVILVVVGTAIWVDQDARKLVAAGATKAQLGGNSPLTWGIATILLWIIVFPWYLVKRGEVKQQLGIGSISTNKVSDSTASPPSGPLPELGWYTDTTNALQQRYWNGQAWTNEVRVSPPSG